MDFTSGDPMDKDNRQGIECGRWVGQGEVMGEIWEQLQLNNNKKMFLRDFLLALAEGKK